MTGAGSLKHGIVLLNSQADADRLVEYGVSAEDAGWDGVFLADHLPPRPGGPEDEVRAMLEFYRDQAGGGGEILVPADPPHADDDWLSFCRDVGATWAYSRCLDADGEWDLSMERVRRGPPTG